MTAVYVVEPNGRVQLRQVRLGETAGDGLVEVLAGLAAGKKISLEPVRVGIEASKPVIEVRSPGLAPPSRHRG